MYAEQLRAGSLVGERRVIRKSTGLMNGVAWVFVRFHDGSRGEYRVGRRVPGIPPRTDMPAGPVGAGRGVRSTGAGWRDGESAGDRHSRFIDRLVYA
ncbi:hypothetical protein [Micromonospora sp. RV43]|uniref:hypothetical protein n=1 Tax=Micromonospora sp. RV43 TaxID=1661387 RepID=UPI00064C1045|nr:hypothetical protein [Micromonospora sp. RV43]